MKKFLNKVMLSAALGILLTAGISCRKFLDKKSNATLIQPVSLEGLQALLDDGATMNMAATPTYGEISADDYFVPQARYNNLSAGDRLLYQWKVYDHGGSGNDWGVCYEKIFNSNYCLDELKNITRSSANYAQWDNVKGSALFFRSYYFLQLLWNYAKAYDSADASTDPGIVLRLTSDFNVPSTRANNEQCYFQVLEDAKQAAMLLPDYPAYVLRPSKWAAYGLLARACLSMRKYNEALLYADSCLKMDGSLMDYNGDPDISLSARFPFKQFNKETVFYSEMNKNGGLQRTDGNSRIDTLLYASYDTNDLRKTAYFSMNADGYPIFKGIYSTAISTMFSGIATDEIYLVRAECYVRMGKVQEGINDLNTLLSKRYKTGFFVPVNAASAENALGIILQERRKELVMRGLRWPDVKRLNKEGSNIVLQRVINGEVFTLQPNADFYALPIPENIIQLAGIAQNE